MRLLKEHWQLITLTILVFALWQTPVMAPLKIFIVFLHEASHAFMTIATGGEVLACQSQQTKAAVCGHVVAIDS